MKVVNGSIVKNKPLTEHVFELYIDVGPEFGRPVPFQFVSLLYGENQQIRRPFSVAGYRDGVIRLIIKKAGRVTGKLSEARPGETISVLGPLGNGLQPGLEKKVLAVAGGSGIAPFLYLFEQSDRPPVYLIYGVPTVDDAWFEDTFTELSGFLLVTEDGSSNYQGYPVDYLLNTANLFHPDLVVAVGPSPMLKALKNAMKYLECDFFVSLESYMGCSLGACNSCLVKTTSGWKRVCEEGPVFSLKELEEI